MRIGMIGARLPIIRCPIARKISGLNDSMDRLRPSHGPQNTPVTSAARKMLMNCQLLRVIRVGLSRVFANRGLSSGAPAGHVHSFANCPARVQMRVAPSSIPGSNADHERFLARKAGVHGLFSPCAAPEAIAQPG